MMRTCNRATALALAALAWATACSGPPGNPEPAPISAAAPEVPEAAATTEAGPLPGQLVPLPNGVACYAMPAAANGSAQIQFGVFAGSLFVAPGLAELSAYTMLRSTDPTSGTASLEQQIRTLGGSIEARVGLAATWFDIRVPDGHIRQALSALRTALENVTRSRTQIARMRDELVAEHTTQVLADPLGAATLALMQAERSSGDLVNALLDLDASAVTLFHSRLYRPGRCLLTVRSARSAREVAARANTGDRAFGQWSPAPSLPGASPVMPRTFESGLYWSESPEPTAETRCAIVMHLPDATAPNAADWLVMHACLTLDGVGGRLEQLQDEAGLSRLEWQARFVQTPDVLALVMTTTASPTEITKLWQLYQRARQSLIDVPPSRSELQIALRRARLNASLPTRSLADRLRLDVNLLMRQLEPGALERQIEQLPSDPTWDPQRAARNFQETPAWMLAVGPGRPDTLAGMVATEALPAGFDTKSQNQPTPENLAAVDPWLARARAATGGDEQYRALLGFSSDAVTQSEGLAAEDALAWSADGTFVRRRAVVGQVIETHLLGDKMFEELDGVRQSLDARAGRLLRHEQMRFPQMLLAAHLRGDRRFRPIAKRMVGDRELYIIEAVGNDFDRLRVHIDTESKLIRVVESWERLSDDTLVHITEEWSDYRRSGGIRVPHRRRTHWNDGQQQSETVFSNWQPR